MAITFEKPLKDFLNKFQKDLNRLQKDLKGQSDEIIKRVKSATGKENMQAKRKEIEALIEKNLKKYEPTINRFVHELSTSAKKAGVDITELEKKVKTNLKTAREKLSDARAKVKTAQKARKVKTAAKKTAKAAAPKKARRPAAADARNTAPDTQGQDIGHSDTDSVE